MDSSSFTFNGLISTQAALWLFGSIAGLYQQPFDSELVIRQSSPPFDLPSLIAIFEKLDFKVGHSSWPKLEQWLSLPFPLAAFKKQSEDNSQLKRPKVLIFDEAVSSLDQQAAEQFAETINRLNGKVTMNFITHQVPQALKVDNEINMGIR